MAGPDAIALEALGRTNLLTALAEVPQGALIFDRALRIIWCNAAGATLLRYERAEDIVGRMISEVSRPVDLDAEELRAETERMWQGEVWAGEIETIRGDGTSSRLRVGRSPVRDEDGRVIAILSLAVDPSEELRAKEALVESEERLSAMFRYSSDIAIVFGQSGRIIFVSPSVEHIAGWKPEQLLGENGWDFIHPDDVAADMEAVEKALTNGRPITREWRMRRSDGSYGWFEQTLTDLTHVPAIGGVIGNFRDVSERHDADEARRESELIMQRVVEVTSDGFIGIDRRGVVTEWNPAAEAIFGWSGDEAIGNELASLIVPEPNRGVFGRAFSRVVRGKASDYLQRPFEMAGQSRTGRIFPVEVSVVHVTVGDRSHFRAFVRDIAERKAVEAKLAHQALTDPLTGLPNRTLLRDRLGRAVSRLGRHPNVLAVMFLDLDRFKLVNDGLGHEAGDDLLTEVARRLRSAVREMDTVARYGGDEFVVVMEEGGSIEAVHTVANRILSMVSRPISLVGRELQPRVSIGIAVTSDSAARPDDLIRDADIAMYRAKDRGGHCSEVFEALMDSRTIARFELDGDLRAAIDASLQDAGPEEAPSGRLRVHYQPIVTFDGQLSGVEALVRWEHPNFGMMSPLEFIPLAEESGLIVPLGEFVLAQAVRQAMRWRAGGAPELTVSVNVAARQLDEAGLPAFVASVLDQFSLPPAALCLELTETVLLRDSGRVLATLEELRALGVRLAIDDFGTGYSSLVYLRRFPVQLVKLDRAFVSGVPTSREDEAIVSAVINLAHALGMEAVAEGIETVEQREALAALGCDLGQGYLWSPPKSGQQLSALLSEHAVHEVATHL